MTAGIHAPFRVIPNGVDLEAWPPSDATERARARAELGLGAVPTALCVGRLSIQKGQDVLLDLWPEVRDRVGDAVLALVGDGPEETSLRARRVAGVTFAGRRQDVHRWLTAADVVVMPSRWEGMSLAMLEAMAVGRSIIATDVAGAREAIGDAGVIVPLNARGELVEAVAARLMDPELTTREGAIARRRVEERFEFGRTEAAVAALYEELLGGVQ